MNQDEPQGLAQPNYIDTHCHLSSDRYDADRDAVIRHCLDQGVRMLAVAADAASSRASLALAEKYPGILASIGVHPCDTMDVGDDDWAELCGLATSPKVAAIGETGLDYYWKNVPAETQKIWFSRHIDLAERLKKPLSIHARDSVADVLNILEPALERGVKAVWHCFVAGKKEIGPALDFAIAKHLYLAVGGLVTFEDQKPLRNQVARIPDELLLLETDAPFLSPRPKKSNRNDPRGVIRVAEVLAELRGVTVDHVASATTKNAEKLFGF